MAFQLNSIVPWGRNMDEYMSMFLLDERDRDKKIAGFGDGPASFNYEATRKGFSVKSFDPIYQFSGQELEGRFEEVRRTVMEQMERNQEHYVWKRIKNLAELETIRMSAMRLFLSDYENGKKEGRYIYHELPNRLPYGEDSFDLGLSSHFLLMYTDLGREFHRRAMTEMLRVCKEIRIFPLVDLDGKKSPLTAELIDLFQKDYAVEVKDTTYEFQKGANKLLIIKKRNNHE